jgi:quercetin dioxygenase-like cupin family protein
LSEREIVCSDLGPALDDLRGEGFRLDLIFPADDPHTALLSNGGDTVRLTSRPDAPPPGGPLPPFAPEFVLTRSGTSPAKGRAGMLYRDLVPSRLGGRYIASHIAIPEGGPVADWVHFHRIALQLIYVRSGWVRVVYEGAAEPFVMHPGDFVLQPPEIRHRVLESSPGLEVVEITAPALHETYADHQTELPSGVDQGRDFGGQKFLLHRASETPWTPFRGGEAQETALAEATGTLAELRTIRSAGAQSIEFAAHDGELVLGFVLDGSATLDCDGSHAISPADCFVIPPGQAWRIARPSDDFRLLHIATNRLD